MKRVDEYVLQQASCRASLLVATAGFRSDDWEDLRQEIILDCLRRSRKFDPARGDWGGFIRGITWHKAAVLVVRRRRIRQEVLVSDLPMNVCENPTDFFDTVAGDHTPEKLDLSLDVQRVLRELPDHLRTVAYLLPLMPIAKIGFVIGRSRTQIYRMIRRIRRAFVEAGLGRTRRAASKPPNQRTRSASRIEKAGRRGIARSPGSRGPESRHA